MDSGGKKKAFNDNQLGKGTPKLFKGSTDSFTAISEQKEDNLAGRAFMDFRAEMETWWEKETVKRFDTDSRIEMADYFSEKYLSKALDKLQPSKVVSEVRKKVSSVIEEFASMDGKMDKHWPAKVFNYTIPGQTEAALLGGVTASEEDPVAPGMDSRGPAGHQRRRAMVQEDEKKKMKQQYEQYMKMKQQNDTHPDQSKAKEMESHLDDIKSLLSSISTTPKLTDM